ncbi:MAG: DUF4465 domain-containing protein [Bacteroidales bacterium]|nr:DUF4465 domain-containing protein [Bacteroidales bacterium]
MKKSIFFVASLLASIFVFAQYDGEVGTENCKAISQNDERIVSWAKGVELNRGTWDYGDERIVDYGEPYMAIGKPDSTTTTAVSLGEGGTALITFDRPIIDGSGEDFVVFENAFAPTFLELAFVEVSSDGVNFFRFPANTTSYHNQENVSEGRTAEHYNNLAGKYELGWGVGFDLTELEDNELLDKNNIRFVRLVDVINGVSTDIDGNIIYDGVSWPTYSQGFDLTGIGIINGGEPYRRADFENLALNFNSYELVDRENNHDFLTGDVYVKTYPSGGLVFESKGYYISDYDWFMTLGFALSNITDDSTATGNTSNLNSYYTSASKYALEGLGKNYLSAFYSSWDMATYEHNNVKMTDGGVFSPLGVYVSQSLASYQNLESSDVEHLYFKIKAVGYDADNSVTGTSEIYLYNEDEGQENMKDWSYMNLASLGEVNKVVFSVECPDEMVSTYFCLDNFVYEGGDLVLSDRAMEKNNSEIKIYPNPARDYINVLSSRDLTTPIVISVYNAQGLMVAQQNLNDLNMSLDVSRLANGTYFYRISNINGLLKQGKLVILK